MNLCILPPHLLMFQLCDLLKSFKVSLVSSDPSSTAHIHTAAVTHSLFDFKLHDLYLCFIMRRKRM